MSSYDPSKSSSYLMYYNVNNLYGWTICQPLSYADFQWVDDVQNFDFTTITLDSATDYIRSTCNIFMTRTLIYHSVQRVRNHLASAMISSSQHYAIYSVISYVICSNVLSTFFVLRRFIAYCNSRNNFMLMRSRTFSTATRL